MKISTLLLHTTLMTSLSSNLLANPPEKAQGVVSFQASEECGPVTTRAEDVDANDDSTIGAIGEACRAFFQDFNAFVSSQGSVTKNCQLEAKIKVPAGKQFRATAASVEGIYNTSNQTWGAVALSYQLDATNGFAEQQQSIGSNSYGDFNLYAQIDNLNFTNCSDQTQYVTLSSEVRLDLSTNDNGIQSMIDVDEVGKSHQLSWNWQWKDCNRFSQPMVSYYKAYNQRNYRAIIQLQGSSGTYESDAGFTGYFYDVKYSNVGRVAEGRWEAQGVQGWFRFTMIDDATGQFKGEWGDDNGTQGSWWGAF